MCPGLGPQRRYQNRAPASGVPPANNGKNATPVAAVAPVAPVRRVPASSPMVQPQQQQQQQQQQPPPKKKTYNPLVGLAKESWSMVKDSTMDLVKLPKVRCRESNPHLYPSAHYRCDVCLTARCSPLQPGNAWV